MKIPGHFSTQIYSLKSIGAERAEGYQAGIIRDRLQPFALDYREKSQRRAAIGLVDRGDERCATNPFPSRELREPAVLGNSGLLLVGYGLALIYHA